MNNELLLRALREKRLKREKHEQEEARRLEEVNLTCPEIGRLMRERSEAIFEGLRQAMAGHAPIGIEQATAERNQRIEMLLAQQGYGRDYLSPIFDCEVCEDSGWAGESRKTLCNCVLQQMSTLNQQTLAQERQSFESYDEEVFPLTPLAEGQVSQRAYMRLIRRECEQYADSLPTGQLKNLLLYGGSGLGKTFLLNAIALRASQRGTAALTLTANSLLNQIRRQYFAREQDQDAASYMSVPLLLIDDLGTEPLWENITVEQLFALIDHRLRAGLYTVISTNLSLTELQQRYTERIMSRLLDQRLCKKLAFMGQDIRLRTS